MNLSKRLLFIAGFVDEDMIIADIGSDHGFLTYYLLNEKIISKAFASDNKIGPFTNLKNTFVGFDKSKIELSLSDGLDYLPSYVNTLLIAGMGGDLIVKILQKGIEKLKNIDYLILSPHSHLEKVRNFMMKNKYCLIDEGIVHDDKYYIVLKYRRGEETLSAKEIEYGPILLKKKEPIFVEYLIKLLSEKKNLLTVSLSETKLKKIQEEILVLEGIINDE